MLTRGQKFFTQSGSWWVSQDAEFDTDSKNIKFTLVIDVTEKSYSQKTVFMWDFAIFLGQKGVFCQYLFSEAFCH